MPVNARPTSSVETMSSTDPFMRRATSSGLAPSPPTIPASTMKNRSDSPRSVSQPAAIAPMRTGAWYRRLSGGERVHDPRDGSLQRVRLRELEQLLGMRGCMRDRAVAARDRTVRDGRDDPASRDEVVRATAQLRADGRRQIGRREDRLERAVPGEQRARGLLADPGHARKAIGWIATQEGVVDVAVARDAVLLVDPRRVDARDLRHAAQRVEHGD